MAGKLLLVALLLGLSQPAFAADEKIDPKTYVCAELVASSIDGQPPLFEGLQLDGYAAAKENAPVADATIMRDLLIAVSDSCAPKPAEKAIAHWQKLRRQFPVAEDGAWRADKTACAAYAANPDDASGFIIWLDAYNRGKTDKDLSIFKDQATLDHFLEECKKNPQKLMLDVINENAK